MRIRRCLWLQKHIISYYVDLHSAHRLILTITICICRFIYTGKMSSRSCENVSWIVLLEGANKLGLSAFCTAIGDYLIEQHEEWLKQNILTVHNCASSTDSLQNL